MRDLSVEVLTKEQWDTVSEGTHYEVFKTYKSKEWDRVDYALLAVQKDKEIPLAYVTCRELSSEAVYWQFGGSLTGTRGTVSSWAAYKKFVEWSRKKYKFVSTYTKNDNIVYLKMALKAGFKIIGTRTAGDEVFLDMLLDLKEAENDK